MKYVIKMIKKIRNIKVKFIKKVKQKKNTMTDKCFLNELCADHNCHIHVIVHRYVILFLFDFRHSFDKVVHSTFCSFLLSRFKQVRVVIL